MKQTMNVAELRRYYEKHNLIQILFCSANQSWEKIDNPIKFNMSFESMFIACNPNVICLKNSESTLHFEKVKCAYIDVDSSPLGTVLDIVCGDINTRDNDVTYTLITS